VLINSFFKKISKPFSKKRTESISKFEDELEERSEEVNWCLNDNSGCLGCKNAKVKLDEINKCKRDDSKCNLCKENLKEFYLTKCKRNQK
jgi:hypothetical protein